jgi:hypothetical protein
MSPHARTAPPTADQIVLAKRVWERAKPLPDAWLSADGLGLVIQETCPPVTPSNTKWFPLTPGDLLRYGMPLGFTHIMLYVGGGYTVGMHWKGAGVPLQGGVVLTHIHHFQGRGRVVSTAKWKTGVASEVSELSNGQKLTRMQIVHRALLSLGAYKYDLLAFNCQHVIARILGYPSTSFEVKEVFASLAAVTLMLLVVVLLVYIEKRRTNIKTKCSKP